MMFNIIKVNWTGMENKPLTIMFLDLELAKIKVFKIFSCKTFSFNLYDKLPPIKNLGSFFAFSRIRIMATFKLGKGKRVPCMVR